MKKRILACLLALVMLVGLLPATVLADPRAGRSRRASAHGQQLNAPQGAYIGVDIMANVKTYTLTLDAQELHDLIEAALVCECQAAQIIGGLKRKGLDLDAQKLVTQNARLSRLVRRMQETKEDKRNAETDSQRRRLV